jgi:hypothetical protein
VLEIYEKLKNLHRVFTPNPLKGALIVVKISPPLGGMGGKIQVMGFKEE